jgi:hypothetical protein
VVVEIAVFEVTFVVIAVFVDAIVHVVVGEVEMVS